MKIAAVSFIIINIFSVLLFSQSGETFYSAFNSISQRYVIRELRVMFQLSDDEEMKAEINILDKAFRAFQTVAVQRELNLLRRNGVTGNSLLKSLTRIYHQHKIQQRIELHEQTSTPSENIPRIVCSEGLLK